MSSLGLQRQNRTVLDNLEPGDLLQFPRSFLYDHWAVYVGDKEVVPLSGVDGQAQIDLVNSFTFSGVEFDKGVIRKDAFWKVVGSSKVCKTKSKDTELKYFEPDEIVKRALSKVGEVGFNVLTKNCEHFASWCRYGKGESNQRHNQTVLDNLEPGDLLQFPRSFLYDHWAVYVGDKEVVHLSGVDGQLQIDLVNLFTISGVESDKGIIRKDAFWKVVGSSKVYKNNLKDTELKYFEPAEIVKRALSKVGEVGYNVLTKNCEHFASWCRYGKGESDQVQNLVTVVPRLALAALIGRGGKEEREKHSPNQSSHNKMVANETNILFKKTLDYLTTGRSLMTPWQN